MLRLGGAVETGLSISSRAGCKGMCIHMIGYCHLQKLGKFQRTHESSTQRMDGQRLKTDGCL